MGYGDKEEREKLDRLSISRKMIETLEPEEWLVHLRKTQEEVAELYPENHGYVKVYREQEVYYWVNVPKWIWEDKSETITNLLDIGCAYGTLAVYAKKQYKCNVHAIDFMDYISKKLTNKYGIEFEICNIELENPTWNVKYDRIIFTEVFEHLNYNPLNTLIRIRELLTDDGVLYLSTPDAAEWGRTLHYPSYKDIPFPNVKVEILDEHIYQYDFDEITTLFSLSGFEIMEFNHSPGFGGLHFNFKLRKCRDKVQLINSDQRPNVLYYPDFENLREIEKTIRSYAELINSGQNVGLYIRMDNFDIFNKIKIIERLFPKNFDSSLVVVVNNILENEQEIFDQIDYLLVIDEKFKKQIQSTSGVHVINDMMEISML